MKLALPGAPKLAYCLNVLPGESWAVQRDALRDILLPLKERFCPGEQFGAGLRVSARALEELQDGLLRLESADLFRAAGLDPFTFNGFPYGTFHAARVKENVYQPDWKTRERVAYTKGLAGLMSDWLGQGRGSISTVPGSFAPCVSGEADEILMAGHLAECALHFHDIEQARGTSIILGLEPEPACFLETTDQFLRFYRDRILVHGLAWLKNARGLSASRAEELLRKHLGLCLDTCHAAIQFENIAGSLQSVRGEGVPIAKIQISNALEIRNVPEARRALEDFVEPVYLHQVRARDPEGRIHSWTDLDEGLRELPRLPEDTLVRIHFHVPLFWEGRSPLASTRAALDSAFWQLCRDGISPHLEMETYTYSVLPESAGKFSLPEMLAREYAWTLAQLK